MATDILTEGLRTIFKQEWDNRYKATLGEWKDELRNGEDFFDREFRAPRNQRRLKGHLLETMVKGNRAEWDCTMLFHAILFSDCMCGLNPLVETNVNVLRKFYIEEFAQRPRGHMSEAEFHSAISTVTRAFYKLGLSTSKLEVVRDQELEYSKEELNFCKICYITTDIITDGLRTIFKQEWDSRYKETLGEWKDEPKNGLDFWNGESPRNHKRNGGALATMRNGDRTEWNLVMLNYAILYSDCIQGLHPTVMSNVDDLRVLRSEVFVHRPRARLSDVEFQTAVKKVFAAFQALDLPTVQIQRIQYSTGFRLETDNAPNIENEGSEQSIPFYILARGAEAKAAYQRALETGETTDKRVKVLLVGQDRVGKTSVGRSLKGEQFIKDESSTDGVQINRPLKYVGIKPWKNSAEEQETTAFHHKCALYITDYFSLSLRNSEGSALEMETITETIADKTGLHDWVLSSN